MKKSLSRSASAVKASSTLAIDSMYKKMKASGVDVIGFGAGEPNFSTPDHIKAAGIEAIEKNITKYTPASGTEAVRRAVCGRLLADYGVSYDPSQIVVSSGAKHNVFIALMTLVDPGDEVILPAPFWVSYYELIKMAGGVPVIVEAGEDEDFKLSPEKLSAAITDKTKALILNSPSNPTGMVYSRDELKAIADVCLDAGIFVIADDIYYRLVYGDTEFTSIVSINEDIRERTILINGVSKSYAMTGWRIGYAAAAPEIAKVMANYQSHSTSSPSSISQYAAIAALSGPQECVEDMRKEFEKRRDYACKAINAIDGVSCLTPHGAFYIMLNVSELFGRTMYGEVVRDCDDFARLFLEKGLVATVPCSGFGSPNHVRISYAASMDDIKNGIARLDKFIKEA